MQTIKGFIFLLIVAACPGCSVISGQYYYVPLTKHQEFKMRDAYFKMRYSRINIKGTAGDSIGAIITSNGIGQPILAGPLLLPVLPVGLADLFYRRNHLFIMDVNVNSNNGNLMTLAIDSNAYKKVRDSLKSIGIATAAPLHITPCYMIINNSAKIPLKVEEYFIGSTIAHNYRLFSDVRFGKVKAMRLVTGNALLDSTLKQITFKRKHRITFNILGPN